MKVEEKGEAEKGKEEERKERSTYRAHQSAALPFLARLLL